MANSTTTIDTISESQSGKAVTANAFFDAASPATTYGRKALSCSGLYFGYYGGNVVTSNGAMAQIANGSGLTTASMTNYMVASKATGAVSISTATTNWNDQANYWRLYSLVVGATTITSYTDYREIGKFTGEFASVYLSQNIQSVNYTLVLADCLKQIFHPSADVTARTFTIPANASVAFPIGTEIPIINGNGAGAITIAITTDTMRWANDGTAGSRTLAANGVARVLKLTATEWVISGFGLT